MTFDCHSVTETLEKVFFTKAGIHRHVKNVTFHVFFPLRKIILNNMISNGKQVILKTLKNQKLNTRMP
jgi:hypothetical protein